MYATSISNLQKALQLHTRYSQVSISKQAGVNILSFKWISHPETITSLLDVQDRITVGEKHQLLGKISYETSSFKDFL